MARIPSCPSCGRRRTAEVVYGSPKLDARLRGRIDEGRVVLGGPATGRQPKWLCLACGAEFGGAIEEQPVERLDLILNHVRALIEIESDLRTVGLTREALSVEKARRKLLASARALDMSSEMVIAALQPPRAFTWSEEDTLLVYDLLKAETGFPSEKSITALARTLGRSRGAVARKLTALDTVGGSKASTGQRRNVDQRIVRLYANSGDRLRREARRLHRLRQQHAHASPRRRATQAARFEFWTALNELMERDGTTVRVRPADGNNWKGYSLGRSGFAVVLSMSMREKRVGCELYIAHPDAKHAFDQLELERPRIEGALGPLNWQRLPGRRACRVVEYRHAALDDPDEWPEIIAWCKERVEAFHKAFRPQVRTLVLVKR